MAERDWKTENPGESVAVIAPIYCRRCYAPYSVKLENFTYTHAPTECSFSHKVFRVDVGSHGQITVAEVTP